MSEWSPCLNPKCWDYVAPATPPYPTPWHWEYHPVSNQPIALLDANGKDVLLITDTADGYLYADMPQGIAERIIAAVNNAATLTAERDEAREWARKLQRTTQTLTCVYCGKEYPPGSPAHGASVLTEHIRVCEKHPMHALRKALTDVLLTGELRRLAAQRWADAQEDANVGTVVYEAAKDFNTSAFEAHVDACNKARAILA